MLGTALRSSEEEMDLFERFALVFGMTLAVIMGAQLLREALGSCEVVCWDAS